MTGLVLDGKDRKYSKHLILCRCSAKHWTLPKQTGSCGQCLTVIGHHGLICDSDKESRKETCGKGDMQITKAKEYVSDSMLII